MGSVPILIRTLTLFTIRVGIVHMHIWWVSFAMGEEMKDVFGMTKIKITQTNDPTIDMG
jgi:hypothetical protein